ncbi:MAG: hypothetical protein ACXW4M_13080 [Anaerolineales bacterium]
MDDGALMFNMRAELLVRSATPNALKRRTGQAYLDTAHTALDMPILIHQGGVMDRPATSAKVVSRFPKV